MVLEDNFCSKAGHISDGIENHEVKASISEIIPSLLVSLDLDVDFHLVSGDTSLFKCSYTNHSICVIICSQVTYAKCSQGLDHSNIRQLIKIHLTNSFEC